MLTPEQVDEIVANFVATIKPYYQNASIKKAVGVRDKSPLPEFWPGYNKAVRDREELRVHIEQGVFPEHLIRSRSPNQTDAEYNYVKENFKQVTLPHYVDYENMVRRALHESNWQMNYNPSKTPEGLIEYLDTEIAGTFSLAQWASNILIKIKTLDPMGVIAVVPESLPLVEGVAEDGSTVMMMDGTEVPKPLVHYFPCERVYGFVPNKWYLVKTYDTSDVEKGGKIVKEGMVLWLIDDQNCWKIEQVGKAHELKFQVELHFNHAQGFPPCTQMLGVPTIHEGSILWGSRYMPAKDLFDLVLLDSTYLLSSKSSSAYPMRVMLGHECEYSDSVGNHCVGGNLMGIAEDGITQRVISSCPSCKGTGISARLGPHGVLFLKEQQRGDSQNLSASDAMTYVEPAGNTMQLLREEMTANINEGRRMLHLHSEVPITGGDATTATQVGVGVKAQMAFIKPESDQLFYLIGFVAECITRQMFGLDEMPYQIVAATQFDLRTEADHLAEITEAIKSGMPPAIVEETLRAYVHARYASNPAMRDMFDTIIRADRLFATGWSNIATMQAKGDVKGWEVALHSDARSIYDELAEDPKFLAGSITERAKAMVEFASGSYGVIKMSPTKKLAEDIVAASDAVNTQTTGEAVQDTALNGAQVESLISIVNQVSTGVISIDTAKPLMRAAFPAMDDVLIDQMLSGIKPVEPELVSAVK